MNQLISTRMSTAPARWRSLLTAMVLLVSLLTLAGFSSVAVAGTTGQGCEEHDGGDPHCYSAAIFDGNQAGVWGEWADEDMSPGPSSTSNSNHIDSEMWLDLTNGAYIETGLYNGFEDGFEHETGGCGCGAYAQFWADTTAKEVQWEHWVYNITPNKHWHSYEIQRAGATNHWNIYIDYSLVGTSTDTEDWTGKDQVVGGELQAPYVDDPSGSYADTYNMYVEAENASGEWYKYGKPNGYDIYSGFNAQIYGNSEFSWNEPL